jgi:hypothetical protein
MRDQQMARELEDLEQALEQLTKALDFRLIRPERVISRRPAELAGRMSCAEPQHSVMPLVQPWRGCSGEEGVKWQ